MKKKTKYIIGSLALLAVVVGAMHIGNKSSQEDILKRKLDDVNRQISELSRRTTDSSNADQLVNLTIQKNALMSKYSSL